ncbi:PIG-L family deacetylase [Tenacibaculum sp. SG-28]|uniref:PIG-L family deacetylase n=1 Tax=Tenacibaculum sp. SG-28 TaxID=754426 RepID=UPI000CF376D8|nr:PIG-L family deacetylase [Tenacibaculum sp. SG-28]PQJ23176.1 LmbE family protein [Tenacibaculum sp. SG-28]
MNKKSILFYCLIWLVSVSMAQVPAKLTSNQIYEKIQKLNFLGSALYIAAHPDDENTRLIAYLANEQKARTAYLSLTRGDGGQNLIGPEMRELLGVIRTQELLAARSIDGGEQRFSRANDFGYSKHPDETLKIWDENEVLADVVWAIRTFKPDVIINRFDHRTPGTTHGHHTTSAMLSVKAFDLAADPLQYREQLKSTDIWQPNRLFFNTSWWFYGSREKFSKADKSNIAKVDVGVYYPLKGLSNNELASIASSQHLCQGFGRLTTRGSQEEYMEFLKGEKPKNQNDIFSGINTTWSRIEGGEEIGAILYAIENNFNFVNPSVHVEDLVFAYQKIKKLENSHWRNIKQKEIADIIVACSGIYLEANASSGSAVPNSDMDITFEVLNRSAINATLSAVTILPKGRIINKNVDLLPNKKLNFKETIAIGALPYSDPYWLQNPWSLGMYAVSEQSIIGNPESKNPINIAFTIAIENEVFNINRPLVYKYSKRDKGEIFEPFEVLPAITTKLTNKVMLFADNTMQEVAVDVRAGSANVDGKLYLKVPEGWEVFPKEQSFSIQKKEDKVTLVFKVKPTESESEGMVKAIAKIGGVTYNKELITINYSHIPKQSVLLPSEAKVVRLDIKKEGVLIGYIQGSGDAVPESLRQIGYTVTEMDPNDINGSNLSKFDAIVLGIRAYNTKDVLQLKQKFLLEYVKNGGNLVVQYNTNRRVDVQAPFLLELSRDRVTDENAKVTFLAEDHPALQYPNKITSADFEGWVQERGLYFPNVWSKEYTPILAMQDSGESPKKGSLLVAQYGKGNYIYTGLSFFRELPAGVPGAYKLFANLLSLQTAPIKQ